jgi:ABC-type amino acid transport substrate-binding protein
LVLVVAALALFMTGCGGSDSKTTAWKMIEKHKSVRIGADPNNLPFVFGEGTGVQGFEVEIGNEIVKEINNLDMVKNFSPAGSVEVKWIKDNGYDKMYELLETGQVEFVMSTMAVDPKRKEKFAYSTPYYDSDDAIAYNIFREDKQKFENLESLSGKKVGVASGRPADAFMSKQNAVNLMKFPSLDNALAALNRSELDAVVGDRPIMKYSTFESYRQVTIAKASFNSYKYAAVVKKDETLLLDTINKTIDRMIKSGQVEQLRQEWYQKKADAFDANLGKREENERISKAAKRISVGITNSRSDFKMNKLDGFQLVLQGTTGKFVSSPIETNGNYGSCVFTSAIPPGQYSIELKILRMVANVEVLEKPVDKMNMRIEIGNSLSISVK